MNTRNDLRSFLVAAATAGTSLLLQPVAFAADQSDVGELRPALHTADREKPCKSYVREHHGSPGKGVDVVKVVYVECPQKR